MLRLEIRTFPRQKGRKKDVIKVVLFHVKKDVFSHPFGREKIRISRRNIF